MLSFRCFTFYSSFPRLTTRPLVRLFPSQDHGRSLCGNPVSFFALFPLTHSPTHPLPFSACGCRFYCRFYCRFSLPFGMSKSPGDIISLMQEFGLSLIIGWVTGYGFLLSVICIHLCHGLRVSTQSSVQTSRRLFEKPNIDQELPLPGSDHCNPNS